MYIYMYIYIYIYVFINGSRVNRLSISGHMDAASHHMQRRDSFPQGAAVVWPTYTKSQHGGGEGG